jgi:hypothetical protein
MNIDVKHFLEIYENYYAVKDSQNYYKPNGIEIPDFFACFNSPLFNRYKDDIVKERYVTEIVDVAVLDFYDYDEEGSNKTMLTEYTNELRDIIEMYKFCLQVKIILDDEITEQFIANNEEYFNFSIAEAREDIINIQTAVACMHFELTNNPIGYFEEKKDARDLV